MLPGINDLLAFGSATFLAVFGLVNHLHARTAQTLVGRTLGHLGSLACAGAIVVVVVELALHEPVTLVLIAACLAGVVALRVAYLRRPRAAQRL